MTTDLHNPRVGSGAGRTHTAEELRQLAAAGAASLGGLPRKLVVSDVRQPKKPKKAKKPAASKAGKTAKAVV